MKFNPLLGMEINGKAFSYKFFQALQLISQTWSQRKAAKELGISAPVLNRRILEAEAKLGFKVVESTGAGSELTSQGIEILESHRRYLTKMEPNKKPVICGGHISSGLLATLAAEFDLDAVIYGSDDESSFYLAQKELLDILALDDPLIAFQRDLDFTPIAFDHLVLISSPGDEINKLEELINSQFIAVSSSSQRLAWKTLQDRKIPFEIIKEVKSPFEAYKLVENGDNTHTFLNASFFSGSDILEEETTHVISLVSYGEFNPEIEAFVDFILGPGQRIVGKQGFKSL
ncbi:MAG: LysR family transcriptional regulator [Methanobacteriaceae archaeon]|nr:LysR family transcriptional regulator [Methanobacteriaceae archaeon]MDP2836614.1 LysR family transcriptional regulator [Methanobacteriaceae archaeon]